MVEIRKLNTLRGVAALIVVIAHYCGIIAPELSRGSGQYGVMLFFLLSGFLMALLYLDKPFTWSGAYHFTVARVARVVPLYLIVVFCSFTLLSLGWGKGVVYDIRTGLDLLSHLLMLSGKSVLWTIPPEIQFYVLFVVFWRLHSFHPHYLWITVGTLFVAGVLFDFDARSYTPLDLDVHMRLISALPYFMVGMIIGSIYRRTGESPLQNRLFILPLALVPLLVPSVAAALFGREWRLWQDLGPLVLIAAIFCSMVFLVPRGDKWLENSVGDFLGRISYSFYLLHLPVLMLLKPYIEVAPLTVFPLFMALALGVATLSYRLIEVPSRTLLRDWLGGVIARRTRSHSLTGGV